MGKKITKALATRAAMETTSRTAAMSCSNSSSTCTMPYMTVRERAREEKICIFSTRRSGYGRTRSATRRKMAVAKKPKTSCLEERGKTKDMRHANTNLRNISVISQYQPRTRYDWIKNPTRRSIFSSSSPREPSHSACPTSMVPRSASAMIKSLISRSSWRRDLYSPESNDSIDALDTRRSECKDPVWSAKLWSPRCFLGLSSSRI
mmetsp:Transcript_19052/g.38852  ORF Transcript_19052/g.38852 Transcript_19052/m.38852 type:complete len:206 (-) Transcript_19052:142-759(-)